MSRLRRLASLVTLLALAACARATPPAPRQTEADPAVARAVMAPLLADPELVALDRDPLAAALPPDDFASATVTAARAEARKLLAGAELRALAEGGACRGCDALLVEARAALLGPGCRARLAPGLEWSLRLPADLPIYPKSHLRDAAGSDEPSCPTRAASFTAPVPAAEVAAFYRALAARAGYDLRSAGAHAVVGRRGQQRMAVIVRPGEGGFARFDLIVAG